MISFRLSCGWIIQNKFNGIQRLNRISSHNTLSEENDAVQYKKYIFTEYSWFLKPRMFSWRTRIIKYDITRRCFASISHTHEMNRKQIKDDQIYGEFGYIIRFSPATNDSFGMTIKNEPYKFPFNRFREGRKSRRIWSFKDESSGTGLKAKREIIRAGPWRKAEREAGEGWRNRWGTKRRKRTREQGRA